MTERKEGESWMDWSASDLKPCPFCGSRQVAQGGSRDRLSVWCGNCGTRGPDVPFPEILIEPASRIQQAYALWNHRVRHD